MSPTALLLLLACAHRVAGEHDPVGAVVILDAQVVGQAPVELRVPLRGATLAVQLGGYRPFVRRLTWFTPRRLAVRLVAEHGPTGTWDAEDVR